MRLLINILVRRWGRNIYERLVGAGVFITLTILVIRASNRADKRRKIFDEII